MPRGVYLRRPPKGRYNVSLRPDLVENMDRTACRLGCSRSEFIELCVDLWATINPELTYDWKRPEYGRVDRAEA